MTKLVKYLHERKYNEIDLDLIEFLYKLEDQDPKLFPELDLRTANPEISKKFYELTGKKFYCFVKWSKVGFVNYEVDFKDPEIIENFIECKYSEINTIFTIIKIYHTPETIKVIKSSGVLGRFTDKMICSLPNIFFTEDENKARKIIKKKILQRQARLLAAKLTVTIKLLEEV